MLPLHNNTARPGGFTSQSNKMAVLTHLPPEILHNILSYVEPEDLARIPLTCRVFNNFIKENNALCRAIYLRNWVCSLHTRLSCACLIDKIQDEPPTKSLNFEEELHDIVSLKQLCSPKGSTPDQEIQSHLPFVYRTVTRLLNHAIKVPAANEATSTAEGGTSSSSCPDSNSRQPARQSRAQTFPPSRNAAFLATLFSDPAARVNFLSRSFLYERGRALGIPDLGGGGGHQLHAYGAESGSESDSDDLNLGPGPSDVANTGTGSGTGADGSPRRRGRRPRLTRTRFGWRRPRRAREAYQMSAKLHCLYGWGLGFEEGGGMPGATDGEARKRAVWAARQGGGAYSLACAKVYDLREYTRGTRWGPFLDEEEAGGEGRSPAGVKVDWEKVEAVLIVLGTNIRSKGLERFPIFWRFWGSPFAGCWGESYIPCESAIRAGWIFCETFESRRTPETRILV